MSNFDFSDIRKLVEEYDHEFAGAEYATALLEFAQEIYDSYYEMSHDENQMRHLLDVHFPDWRHADWDYDVEWEGTYLSVVFKNLVVDDAPVRDGDPEDMPHPIFKDIALYVDIVQLCVDGIWELNNHG